MIIDLLIHEIMYNFPEDKPIDGQYPTYNLYCSEAFYRSLVESFKNAGFQIPAEIESEKTMSFDEIPLTKSNFVVFQLPPIGYLWINRTLEQGYKIEKYEE